MREKYACGQSRLKNGEGLGLNVTCGGPGVTPTPTIRNHSNSKSPPQELLRIGKHVGFYVQSRRFSNRTPCYIGVAGELTFTALRKVGVSKDTIPHGSVRYSIHGVSVTPEPPHVMFKGSRINYALRAL